MSITMPNQVLRYLDTHFPQAKQQMQDSEMYFYLRSEAATSIKNLLDMIVDIPPHLIALHGDTKVEFDAALSAIQFSFDAWNAGDSQYKLQNSPGQGWLHPLTILRKSFIKPADEVDCTDTNELIFIADTDLRSVLRTDIGSVEKAIEKGDWKKAIMYAGSIIETFLICRLQGHEVANPGAGNDTLKLLRSDDNIDINSSKKMDNWNLHDLIEISAKIGLIQDETAKQSRIVNNYNNLLNFSRKPEFSMFSDHRTALSTAKEAIENLIRDFS